jgi:hypothetical protein
MTADSFVSRLVRIANSLDILRQYGYPDDEIEEMRTSYSPPERPGVPQHIDPVIDLLARYDCSRVEIGMIRLAPQPIEQDWAWAIGKDEADPLVLDKRSGEIKLMELRAGGIAQNAHVISIYARTSGMFLDALALTAETLLRQISGEFRAETEACRQGAELCADAAGGDEYMTPYLILLGC